MNLNKMINIHRQRNHAQSWWLDPICKLTFMCVTSKHRRQNRHAKKDKSEEDEILKSQWLKLNSGVMGKFGLGVKMNRGKG